MTASVPAVQAPALVEYAARLGPTTGAGPVADLGPAPGVDELLGADRATRAGQDTVAVAIENLGLGGLLAARAEARRLVEDDGITYGQGGSGRPGRGWVIDPLPLVIGAGEWARLEAGLRQRARLLDLIFTDLYGPRELLRRRVIPAEIVLGHAGFLPQVDRIRTPGATQLVLAATDLGRDADGTWLALADRTQVPTGAGYAMANRRITTRVMAGMHRGTPLARLRGFFHTMTRALQAMAPPGVDLARVVLLSPGSATETAYEMAFLSTLLGFPVVESEDLTTRAGRVSIRTRDRLEQVDVILRRVDAAYSDPLDLRPDSRLGVTGLIEATRLGNVSVANPLGSGVLENPALLAFLPRIARDLIGEDLDLPSAPTFWCGDPTSRQHVLANLDSLVLKPIARESGPFSRFGWELGAAVRDDLRRQIEARPWAWVGQDPVAMSTAPVVTPRGLEPRRLVLRTFAAALDGEHHVMPGGLGRVARSGDQHFISSMTGALAKDVWVLTPPGAEVPSFSLPTRDRPAPLHLPIGIAPRVADNLFWMGRYAERAEGTARLLRVADDLVEDHAGRPGTPGGAAMSVLLQGIAALTRTSVTEAPFEGLRRLTLSEEVPGSVAYAVAHLIDATYQVRDQLSLDTWIVLSRLQRILLDIPPGERQLQPHLGRLLESLLAVAGITAESMMRDATWGFLDGGVRIERAQHMVAMLRHTLASGRSPVVDGQVTEAVLSAAESVITYRRRTAAGVGPASPAVAAVLLLVTDPDNPRSVRYQLDRLAEAMTLVGDDDAVATARRLSVEVAHLDAEALCDGRREGLAVALDGLGADLRRLAESISRRHFTRKPTQQSQTVAWATSPRVEVRSA